MTIREDGEIHLYPVTAEELETYVYWMTHGEWRHYDPPRVGGKDSWEPAALSQYRKSFLKTAERQAQSVSNCTLYLKDDPIGMVNSYGLEETSVCVGIDICVDSCLHKGLGTRSLRLWVDYWFEDRKLHRLGLETWSFNKRMIRVAEKCGFVLEGVQREMQQWNGAWEDMHIFGMTEDDYARVKKPTREPQP